MVANGEIIGLVLTGKINPETGEDQAWNRFHGKPQLYHNFDQLRDFCSRVYIVCGKFQKSRIFGYYPTLVSPSDNPVSGLPGIFAKIPSLENVSGVLVVSTDFPLFSYSELKTLSGFCNQELPVALYNSHENRIEPGIAWYPIQTVLEIIRFKPAQAFPAQEFLESRNTLRFRPDSDSSSQPMQDFSLAERKNQTPVISGVPSPDQDQCLSAE